MAKLQTPSTAGFNAGKKEGVKYIQIDKIKIDPEIAGIFNISEKILEDLKQSIREHDFYEEEPVIVWKGHDILLDGRTRYTAAKEVGKARIPFVEKEFASRDEAILFTIERQALRRNITGEEVISAVGTLLHGRKEKKDGTGRLAEIVAKKLGVSAAIIYQASAILREGTPKDIKAVKKGEKSIKKTYNEIKDRQRPEKEFDAHGLQGNVVFLKAAIVLLAEKLVVEKDLEEGPGLELSIKMLMNHFLKKNEKAGFYKLLPAKISKQLPRLPLLNRSSK